MVPAFDADVANDQLLLRQFGDLLSGPGALVLNESGKFELPATDIDRLDLGDFIIGIEARRLDDLCLGECRREVVGPKQESLHTVIKRGDGLQYALHSASIGHVASCQQRQRAETDSAAQDLAPVDLFDELLVLLEDALIE